MLDFILPPLNRYLHEPTLQHFLELRLALTSSEAYSPYENYKSTAYPLLNNEQYSEALEYLRTMLPKWFLNPGIHRVLAYTYHKLARQNEELLERNLADFLLRGILASGDGSEARPYLVLFVDDEYEVLETLGQKSHIQRLIQKDGCRLDALECEDGAKVFFDVTAPSARLEQQMQRTK